MDISSLGHENFLSAELDLQKKFGTPATHALSGEAGNAIKRFFCFYFLFGYLPSRLITDESLVLLFKLNFKSTTTFKLKDGDFFRDENVSSQKSPTKGAIQSCGMGSDDEDVEYDPLSLNPNNNMISKCK
ncbi:unnamed protein product [Didymodactylos carnosus]|uniref:Uncharacterized protein n=1 Tax=Didymodactylos carnosus TaxID=1234261 RepID=A0A815KIY5_9BILA|nr:unnamed protein product [Didymodactylos carnosus]CAF1390460.1 unnamed protein product [Didymodactylos carnosus]CAF3828428.1 unnamed protein product [Didymodactylos carnosus]CAF4285164.1 unnamed protein product [Didymodactylos carnosus]